MSKQVELLKKALELVEENPNLEIHLAVSCDEINDEFGWVNHKIKRVEKSPYYEKNETILTDIDEIREHFEDVEDRDVSEEEAIARSKEVILITTELY